MKKKDYLILIIIVAVCLFFAYKVGFRFGAQSKEVEDQELCARYLSAGILTALHNTEVEVRQGKESDQVIECSRLALYFERIDRNLDLIEKIWPGTKNASGSEWYDCAESLRLIGSRTYAEMNKRYREYIDTLEQICLDNEHKYEGQPSKGDIRTNIKSLESQFERLPYISEYTK